MFRGVAARERGLQDLQRITVRYQQQRRTGVTFLQLGDEFGDSRHDAIGALHGAVAVIRILLVTLPYLGIGIIRAEFVFAEETLAQARIGLDLDAAAQRVRGDPRGLERTREIGTENNGIRVERLVAAQAFPHLGTALLAEPVAAATVQWLADDDTLLVRKTVAVAHREVTITEAFDGIQVIQG